LHDELSKGVTIMSAILNLLYREYCKNRLAEMNALAVIPAAKA
jgi:hypothetical protein